MIKLIVSTLFLHVKTEWLSDELIVSTLFLHVKTEWLSD